MQNNATMDAKKSHGERGVVLVKKFQGDITHVWIN